jgi:hypothetical protein
MQDRNIDKGKRFVLPKMPQRGDDVILKHRRMFYLEILFMSVNL